MNKFVILLVGTVVVVGGVSIFLITKNNDTVSVTDSNTGKTETVKTGDSAVVRVESCDILTESIAKNILGESAVKGDLPMAEVSTKDVSVSNCVYTAKIDPTGKVRLANTKGVGLLIRAGKTKVGTDSNKDQFGSYKPAGVQDVSGFGEMAFFNPQFGQLNILKDGNWYIVSNYLGSATGGTLDSDEAFARALGF